MLMYNNYPLIFTMILFVTINIINKNLEHMEVK